MNQKRMRIRVGVLSSSEIWAPAIIRGIQSNRELQFIAWGATPDQLVQHAQGMPLDILVLDTVFNTADWASHPIRLVREIREKLPRTQIVSVLESERSAQITAMLRMLVSAVILKTSNCIHDIVLAIRYARRGSLYLSSPAQACLTAAPFYPDLTEKELEVIHFLHQCQENSEMDRKRIANLLHISDGTLKIHIRNLRDKLNASTDADVVAACSRLGLVI